MTKRELYSLLHLLTLFGNENLSDGPIHLAVLILTIEVEKDLNRRKDLG